MKLDSTPSFDFGTDPAPVDVIGTEGEPTSRSSQLRQTALMAASAGSEWREVPQARFLSWSPAMQYAYCAARDRDSAITAAERGEDPAFYLTRAQWYAKL